MWYHVAKPSEFLVITGRGIDELKIAKKAMVWPFQKCEKIDVTPVNYTFEVNAMSKEKLSFLLPAVFTIGPRANDHSSLVKYARLLSLHQRDSHDVKELVQGIIEGETRVLAASMSMEDVFKGTKDFKREVFEKVQLELNQFGLLIYNANIKQLVDVRGHEYFSYLGQKTQMEAANRAKVEVAEAKMKGDVGFKQREGLTIQNAAKIDVETKVITAQRKGKGKMEEIKVGSEVKIFENQQEAEVSEANAKLATKKAAWSQQAKMAEVVAEKAVAIREAELQQEVERKNALTKTENFKAQFLSRANVEYEIKVQEANSEYYQKQTAADAILYEKQKLAEARRIEADAGTYAEKQAADAALYAKKKEAEGLVAFAEAQGIYIRTLLSALGGNYIALRDFLMINERIYTDIAKYNAEAIRGLQPKITIWSTGASEGDMTDGTRAGKGNGVMKEMASLYSVIPPLLQTVYEQTSMLPPPWLDTCSTSLTTSTESA
ncbi:flotillin-like protein 6 [Nicotiana tabacum]|uniref:Flotillin-like n=1 Tax=Nicotiana tabacum TaxID=4097 RepID=A0A1S3X7X1_TOBAC|nr:PREDICTED: flotillin-like protein 6 [Nicotiana tabacum]XP_016435895.1 PREDICTED: flotillin-like protein 6 [Nicotiana tabacum]